MAQDGALAAGQHGGKPARLRPDVRAQRIHAAMEAEQVAVRHLPPDLAAAQAELVELVLGDESVLLFGGRVQISTHTVLM